MSDLLMIYGATGYTGRLIVAEAVARGLKPVVSGRNPAKLAAVAEEFGLEARPVALDDAQGLARALDGIKAVLLAAGPFAATYQAMTTACLTAGVHYLDITGEPDVFMGCMALDGSAREAGITIMPGVGFDVVPTDCVALMLKERMPDATELRLAFGGMNQASRGTARTMMNHIDKPVFVRRDGRLCPRTGPAVEEIDFGDGPALAHATTWGDIVTAAHTTGIQSIEVFVRASETFRKVLEMGPVMRKVLASRLGRPLVAMQLRAMPDGPDAEMRKSGRMQVYGRATNAGGEIIELRLETPEGYRLTAETSVRIAERVMAGEVPVGYQTPAGALGSDFILGINGVVLKD